MKKKKSSPPLTDDRDIDVLYLEDLAPEDWLAIKRIATALYEDGLYSEDGVPYQAIQFKCAVAAFSEWLSKLEVDFCLGSRKTESVH